uniref:phytanoyl-CoA dioxygenase family protein n=1 Tax=Sphingobium sp. Sx8-8 TaxID=2933617 RepID=UPI001F55EC8B
MIGKHEKRAEHWMKELLDRGYCIIPDASPIETIAALNSDLDETFHATPFGKGRFYGNRTKRFGSLLKRSRHAPALVLQPTIMAMAEAILGAACERIQLNVAQAIEIHPGEVRQLPHRDQD